MPEGIYGGNIVGWYADDTGQHGFLFDGTTWTDLNSVPEPTTLILIGSGLVGLAEFRKKFKK